MTPPLIRQTIDVVLGGPQVVADRIELVFGEHGVAAKCKVDDTLVRIEVSTLGLGDDDDAAIKRTVALIVQAASDVAATIELVAAE